MPKRIGNIADEVCSFDNLLLAFHDVERSRRYKPQILRFKDNFEENLFKLQDQLRNKTWRPHPYHNFIIFEPKMRLISAPCIEDRIVQHAICNLIEPIIDSRFIYSSFACRKGKGMLGACQRVQHYLRQQTPGKTVYWLKIDFKKFFHSIPHDTIKKRYRRYIKDEFILFYLDLLIDSFPTGLPLGALTSQLGANLVNDALDHFICDKCSVRFYARYMDDIVILSQDRDHLVQIFDLISVFAETELGTHLNMDKSMIKVAEYYRNEFASPVECGINFAGYVVYRYYMKPRKKNVLAACRRFKKMKKQVEEGKLPKEKLDASVNSFMGYMKHCRWCGYADRALDYAGKRRIFIGTDPFAIDLEMG